MRYSVHNKMTDKIEFKFSGLAGTRTANCQEMLTNVLHGQIASVLLTENFRVKIPVPRVEITKIFDSIKLLERPDRVVNFHILNVRRLFLDEGIFANVGYERAKKEFKVSEKLDRSIELRPLILAIPYGFKRSNRFHAPSRDESLLKELKVFLSNELFKRSSN